MTMLGTVDMILVGVVVLAAAAALWRHWRRQRSAQNTCGCCSEGGCGGRETTAQTLSSLSDEDQR